MDEDIVRVRVKSNGGSVEVQIERKGLILGIYDSKDDPVPDVMLSPSEATDLISKLGLVLASRQKERKKSRCDRPSSSTGTERSPALSRATSTRQKI